MQGSTSLTSSTPFPIFVSPSVGKTIVILVDPSDTIDELKAKIRDKTRVPIWKQLLIHDGVVIDLVLLVELAGITKYSVVRVNSRLRGAGTKFGVVVFGSTESGKSFVAPPEAHVKRILEQRVDEKIEIGTFTSKKTNSKYIRAFFSSEAQRDLALEGGHIETTTRTFVVKTLDRKGLVAGEALAIVSDTDSIADDDEEVLDWVTAEDLLDIVTVTERGARTIRHGIRSGRIVVAKRNGRRPWPQPRGP